MKMEALNKADLSSNVIVVKLPDKEYFKLRYSVVLFPLVESYF